MTGCCIPIDHSNPIYEPIGTPKNIPYSISAPFCAELDGFSGEMFCGGATPARPGPCGVCTNCVGGENFFLGGFIWYELPIACVLDSCSIDLCLGITCEDVNPEDMSLENCCRKLIMTIGSNTQLLNGIGVAGGYCSNYIKVSPTSCVCSGDPDVMPAVRFPLIMPFDCQEFFDGLCAPKSKCCDTFRTCDLTDAEVII